MERTLILLVAAAALMAFVAPGVQGTSHLSFANNTQVNITRSGCGVSKLCLETPTSCDPAMNSSCLFVSFVASAPMAPNGSTISVELRGDSMGYVALGLANPSASMGITMLFICAQNISSNGTFFFRTMQRNNTDESLTPTERRVKEIRGQVKGNIIMCEFDIPNLNATSTRQSTDSTVNVLLGTGNVTGNMIGPFSITLNRVLNLADPAANTTNPTNPNNPTTAAPTNMTMTTSSGTNVHPYAVLLLLSVLSLPFMIRA
uniref:putative ferric-chelate reductase 1 n=1 Tax=Semicossyphus pulcher TaxID=241346 RepID=UPI0037E78D4A